MKKKLIFIIIIFLIAAAVFSARIGRDSENKGLALLSNQEKEVETETVASLSGVESSLPLLGAVKSESEVVLRSEIPGEVKRVYKKVGQFVRRGELVAELKNSVQRASVMQAEAQVDAAKARLLKTRKGLRDEQIDIFDFNRKNAEQALREAKISAINTLRSAFSVADDAVRGKTDQLFSNPKSRDVKINFVVPNAFEVEDERILVEDSLINWESSNKSLIVDSDLIRKLENADKDLNLITGFLDLLASEVNSLTTNVILPKAKIDLFKALIVAARGSVNNAQSGISRSRENLNSKSFLLDIAKKQYEQAKKGERSEDISSAEAALKQAEGSLALARANLEKTFVRAAISGILTLLSVDRGDFVSGFEEVAIVSNKGALEIVTFISENDLDSIFVGAKAKVNGKYNGVVTSVARALDKKTKKIEVKISVSDSENSLISGQSIRLNIERKNNAAEFNQFLIPISALKIGSNGTVVFTVDKKNKIVQNPIIEGSIVGDRVIVKIGLTPEMEIVLDARGLKEGDRVKVRR